MDNLFNRKKKNHSKGFLGGLFGMTGFALLAFALTSVGVEVNPDELKDVKADADVLVLQSEQIRNVFIPACVAFFAACLGFIGNVYRKSRIAFLGDGKTPWKSRGVVGNLSALVAAGVVAVSTVTSDFGSVEDLTQQGKLLLVQLEDILAIAVPAVVGIKGALFGLVGRWQADKTIS